MSRGTVARLWSEVGGWHTERLPKKKPGPPSSGVPRAEAARYRARRWAKNNPERVKRVKAGYYADNREQILSKMREKYAAERRVHPASDRRCARCGGPIPESKRPQAKWCRRACGNTARVRAHRARKRGAE